ncbi:hypothetical protein AQUCO_00201271v1 [Aquilegia coerulea]|uniref:RNA-dependent RNA polymerase n=1 Tax=Aquilegia coerulea TaxID=218851 RepID=A0A2G5F762_AQUCA|nr:hypothetical protein AQUCO_00201271v1 [Aquilegia coerulea]
MGRTIQVSGFPSNVTAQLVKEFLETHAGEDSIYALKVRPQKSKGPPRALAVVQFTSTRGAETISSYQRLYYGTSCLNVRNMERDIVPKPRVMMLSLDVTALHFGCQVSDENFKVFWTEVNAVMNFGFGLRKVEVLLSHEHKDYKLELSYDSIWQIQLRRSRSLMANILVIQVFSAPRVFEKLPCSSGGLYGDPDLNFFRDIPEDQWVRTTDFTSSCIGQSSAICLELPNSCNLSSIRENFHSYREVECQFSLDSGSCFSDSLELVPIVGPPLGLELPYSVLFKINSLVQSGCLSGPTLDVTFFRLVHPRFIPVAHIECALEKLYYLRECCYQPVKWLTEQYRKYNASKHHLRSPSLSLDDGLVYIRRVQVTPSKVYFCGPEVNVSNRVIRHYNKSIDNFIRVSFVDEDWEKMRATDLAPRSTKNEDKGHTALYDRILTTLKNGIAIGDKKFDFLAFSSSQLRDNSAWMFASDDGLTAASIRKWMGDFHEIRNVAKYAARLGQSFSSSTETLTVARHEIEIIDDVEVVRNGKKYVFSDGIGKISLEFAHRVAKKCGINGFTPSSFQIRYGGYKGVVAVNPGSIKKLSLRKSMSKYTSTNTKLDVLTWSKFQPCFLNRQIVTLLSTLGVKDHIFEKKQKAAVDQLDLILTDPLKAHETLEVMSPGENVNVLKEMLMCGYKPDLEPYLSLMLQSFRALKLSDLRKKTRIFLPNGRALMGCLDETKTLEYGQVFVQVSRMGIERRHGDTPFMNKSDRRCFIVERKVIVAKNPCLHPGDVRVLQAVNIPDLHHMVDCVVFPQKGSRPHPNECSGSDLDGDIYFVSWDRELIPPRQIDPMDYAAEATVQLDHDVTIEVIIVNSNSTLYF